MSKLKGSFDADDDEVKPFRTLLDRVKATLLSVEFDLQERESRFKESEKAEITDRVLKELKKLDEEFDNLELKSYDCSLWLEYLPWTPSRHLCKLLDTNPVEFDPLFSLLLDHWRLKTVSKRTNLLEEEIERLKTKVQSDDDLQLGSIAFEFEKSVLNSVGGEYQHGFRNKKGTWVFTKKFSDLHQDYMRNIMKEEEKKKYETFLKRVAPEWSDNLQVLSERINHSVGEFKKGRVAKAHPPVDSRRFDDLHDIADDQLVFRYLTSHLTSIGAVQ